MRTVAITGNLVLRTALHVGSGRGGAAIDALLRRTAGGDLVVPGTAIAGALRTIATRLAPRLHAPNGTCRALGVAAPLKKDRGGGVPCGCATCHLFGDIDPQASADESKGGRAARLWVADAHLHATVTAVRDSVGIDRTTRTAARRDAAKHDQEVLPAGTIFRLRLELEDQSEADEQLLAVVLAEWVAGRGSLGGRTARGLGAIDLSDVCYQVLPLETVDDVVAYLVADDPLAMAPTVEQWLSERIETARSHRIAATHPHGAASWVEARFDIQATGPFLSNDFTRAMTANIDHAPLKENTPILPGASLRGALRSHAERIARTLASADATDAESFARRRVACNPLARPTERTALLPLQACDALLGESDEPDKALCLACRLFGSVLWGSRMIVEDAPFLATGTVPEPVWKVQDFLAIDRFTGGGRDTAKFDAVSLWKPRFKGRIRIENPAPWELGWLVLTLRDLAEGLIPLGFGASKGYGTVMVPNWDVTVGFIQLDDAPFGAPATNGAKPDGLYDVVRMNCTEGDSDSTTDAGGDSTWVAADPTLAAVWATAASGWVDAFVREVAGSANVADARALAHVDWKALPDTYFGQSIQSLIAAPGKEVSDAT